MDLVHEGKKPFQCNTCNYSTSLKEHLETHIESVHQENKFNCQTCGLHLSDEMSLIEHIVFVH